MVQRLDLVSKEISSKIDAEMEHKILQRAADIGALQKAVDTALAQQFANPTSSSNQLISEKVNVALESRLANPDLRLRIETAFWQSEALNNDRELGRRTFAFENLLMVDASRHGPRDALIELLGANNTLAPLKQMLPTYAANVGSENGDADDERLVRSAIDWYLHANVKDGDNIPMQKLLHLLKPDRAAALVSETITAGSLPLQAGGLNVQTDSLGRSLELFGLDGRTPAIRLLASVAINGARRIGDMVFAVFAATEQLSEQVEQKERSLLWRSLVSTQLGSRDERELGLEASIDLQSLLQLELLRYLSDYRTVSTNWTTSVRGLSANELSELRQWVDRNSPRSSAEASRVGRPAARAEPYPATDRLSVRPSDSHQPIRIAMRRFLSLTSISDTGEPDWWSQISPFLFAKQTAPSAQERQARLFGIVLVADRLLADDARPMRRTRGLLVQALIESQELAGEPLMQRVLLSLLEAPIELTTCMMVLDRFASAPTDSSALPLKDNFYLPAVVGAMRCPGADQAPTGDAIVAHIAPLLAATVSAPDCGGVIPARIIAAGLRQNHVVIRPPVTSRAASAGAGAASGDWDNVIGLLPQLTPGEPGSLLAYLSILTCGGNETVDTIEAQQGKGLTALLRDPPVGANLPIWTRLAMAARTKLTWTDPRNWAEGSARTYTLGGNRSSVPLSDSGSGQTRWLRINLGDGQRLRLARKRAVRQDRPIEVIAVPDDGAELERMRLQPENDVRVVKGHLTTLLRLQGKEEDFAAWELRAEALQPIPTVTGLTGRGTPLAIGVPGAGNLDDDATIYVQFDAIPGHRYVIETYNLGDDVDTEITLYDSTGQRIGYDDDGGEGLASRLALTLQGSSPYILEVHNQGSGGSFELIAVED
jgi:hypothetical protein